MAIFFELVKIRDLCAFLKIGDAFGDRFVTGGDRSESHPEVWCVWEIDRSKVSASGSSHRMGVRDSDVDELRGDILTAADASHLGRFQDNRLDFDRIVGKLVGKNHACKEVIFGAMADG